MKIRNTVIVLVLAALIGGYVWYQNHAGGGTTANLLFKVKAADINRITLEYPDRQIELERTAGKWQMLKPIRSEADGGAADALASELASCEVKRTVDEHPDDLALYGLKPPAVTVLVSATDKGPLGGVEVGKDTPIGYAAYIKRVGEPAVLTTSAAFVPGTKRTVTDLRNHRLTDFQVNDVKSITVIRPDGSEIELARGAGDKWQLVRPMKYPADPQHAQRLATSFAAARVNNFVDDHPTPAKLTEYGFDKPVLTVTALLNNGKRESLQFGSVAKGAALSGDYVRRLGEPPVFTIQNWALADANQSLADLRDLTVFPFEKFQVQQVKVASGGTSYDLTRMPDGKWVEKSGSQTSPADPIKIEQMLDQLHDLKGDRIVDEAATDLSKYGLAAPGQEITLLGTGGKSLGWLKLSKIPRYNTDAKGKPGPLIRTDAYAASNTTSPGPGSTVFFIYPSEFDKLAKAPTDLRLAAAPVPMPSPASVVDKK